MIISVWFKSQLLHKKRNIFTESVLLNNSNCIRQAFWFKLMYIDVKNIFWTKQRANSLRVFHYARISVGFKSRLFHKKQNNDWTLLPGKSHPLGCAFAVLVLRGILKCGTLWAQHRGSISACRGSNLEAQSRHSEAKIHRLNLCILRLKSQRLNYRRSI